MHPSTPLPVFVSSLSALPLTKPRGGQGTGPAASTISPYPRASQAMKSPPIAAVASAADRVPGTFSSARHDPASRRGCRAVRTTRTRRGSSERSRREWTVIPHNRRSCEEQHRRTSLQQLNRNAPAPHTSVIGQLQRNTALGRPPAAAAVQDAAKSAEHECGQHGEPLRHPENSENRRPSGGRTGTETPTASSSPPCRAAPPSERRQMRPRSRR